MAYIQWADAFGTTNATSDVEIESGEEIEITGEITVRDCIILPGGKLRHNLNENSLQKMYGNLRNQGQLILNPSGFNVENRIQWPAGSIDTSTYVGGVELMMPDRPTDKGLWFDGNGLMNLLGTYRRPWTRAIGSLIAGQGVTTWIETKSTLTGWQPGDRVLITPMASPHDYPNDFWARKDVLVIQEVDGTRFKTTTPLLYDHLSVDPLVGTSGAGSLIYTAEIANLTRNVVIGGSDTPFGKPHMHGHTHTNQHTFRNIRMEYMGSQKYDDPSARKPTLTGVLGCYPLHMHHGYDTTRGMVVANNVVEKSGNRAYVPHESNGITLYANIAHDVKEDAFFWDKASRALNLDSLSHDSLWLLNLVCTYGSATDYSVTAFELRAGDGNISTGNVACGGLPGTRNAGFEWPSLGGSESRAVWNPFHNNLSHNNAEADIFTWSNIKELNHIIEKFVCFHSGKAIINGAYSQRFTYAWNIYFGHLGKGLEHHSGATVTSDETVLTAFKPNHTGLIINGPVENAITLEQQRLGGQTWVDFRLCELRGYTGYGAYVNGIGFPNGGNQVRKYSFEGCIFDGAPGSEMFWIEDDIPAGSILRYDDLAGTSFELRAASDPGIPPGSTWVPQWNAWRTNVASFGSASTTLTMANPTSLIGEIEITEPTTELSSGELPTSLASTWQDRFTGTSRNTSWTIFGTSAHLAVNNALEITMPDAPGSYLESGFFTPKEYSLVNDRSWAHIEMPGDADVPQYYALKTVDGLNGAHWYMHGGVLYGQVLVAGVYTTVVTISSSIPDIWAFRGSADGETLYFETSNDNGATWTPRGSTTALTSIASLHHHVGAAVLAGQPGGVATFRGVNLLGHGIAFIPQVQLGLSPIVPQSLWFNEDVEVVVSSDDPAATLEYRLTEDGAWLPYTVPVILTAEGITFVEAQATNPEGSTRTDLLVQIDKSPPQTELYVEQQGNGTVLVTLETEGYESAFGDSPIAVTRYRLGGVGEFIDYEDQFLVTGIGLHGLEYFSTDIAGNEEETQEADIEVLDLFEYKVKYSIGPTVEADPDADATLLMDWDNLGALTIPRPWAEVGEKIWMYINSRDTLDNAESGWVAQEFNAQLWQHRGFFTEGATVQAEENWLPWFDWSLQEDLEEPRPLVPEGSDFVVYLQARNGSTLVVSPVAAQVFEAFEELDPPAAPVVVATAVSTSQIDLAITPGAGSTSQEVHASQTTGFTPGPGTLLATIAGGATSYSHTGLSPSATWYYKIIGINAAGQTPSAQDSETTDAPGNTAPVVTILTPLNGTLVTQGEENYATATAIDAEDLDITDDLSWVSNLDGVVGSGGSFNMADLSVGVHSLTPGVTDSNGAFSSATVVVFVRAEGEASMTVHISLSISLSM